MGINNLSYLLNASFGLQRTGTNNLFAAMNGIGGSLKTPSLSSLLANTQQTNQTYLDTIEKRQTFNRTELSLRNAVSKLNVQNPESVFNQNTATSSNANAVTAAALPNAVAGIYQIETTQLAKGQQITGGLLNAAETNTITTANGYGQMEIAMNGKTQLVTYQLTGAETNSEALNIMANAINNRNTEITAQVAIDQGGNAKLVLEGPTGAENNFTITDTVGNGAAITAINNAANITQSAQNAQFKVNGIDFESATNEIELVNTGITLNLKQTTGTEPINITIQSSGVNLEKDIRSFVAQYNETLGKLKTNPAGYARQNITNLQNITVRNASALNNIGITVGGGGELRINEQKFQEILTNRPNDINTAFNGISGFTTQIQAEAERAINQSIGATASNGFTNTVFGGNFRYSINTNQTIASNLGLFFNNYW